MAVVRAERFPRPAALVGSWLFLVLFLCSQFYLFLPQLGLPRQWLTALLKALPEIAVWMAWSTLLMVAVVRWPPSRRLGRWMAGHALAAAAASGLAIVGSACVWRGVGLLVGEHWPLPELLAQIFEQRLHLGFVLYGALLAVAVVTVRQGRSRAPEAGVAGALETPRPVAARRRLRHLLAKERERARLVGVDDVVWIEAARNDAIVHTVERSYSVRMTLAVLEATLDPERFVRVHRSAIVAVDRIRELAPRAAGARELLLTDGTRLTMSRTYRDRLESALGQRL